MGRILLAVALICALAACDRETVETDPARQVRTAQEALAAGRYDEAFQEYLRLAEKRGNPLAQFTLGLFFQNGWGRPRDPAQACSWFEKAAESDIPAAAHLFAECLATGVVKPPEPAEAAVWYERAAGLGHLISWCSLAELYVTGAGVPRDPEKGLQLCRQAAERGAVPASVRMGRFFLEGGEDLRDFGQAAVWFESAAEAGSAEAQYLLGTMVRDGLGQEPSPERARVWFESAASSGFAPAYLPCGLLYLGSPAAGQLPAEHDLAKAYLWLRAAVERAADPKELAVAEEALASVREIMPATWAPELDEKVSEHLARYPSGA